MESVEFVKLAQEIYLDLYNARLLLFDAKYIKADRKLQSALTKNKSLIERLAQQNELVSENTASPTSGPVQ